MQTDEYELDRLARHTHYAHSALLRAGDALRKGQPVDGLIEEARQDIAVVLRSLVRDGAEDPHPAPPQRKPLSPELLSSEKAQAFAQAMRAAAEACKAMEEERHGKGVDGFWEMLEDYAIGAEHEALGPAELRN